MLLQVALFHSFLRLTNESSVFEATIFWYLSICYVQGSALNAFEILTHLTPIIPPDSVLSSDGDGGW